MNNSPISVAVNAAGFRLQALSAPMDSEFDSTGLFMAAISGIFPAADSISTRVLPITNKAGGIQGISSAGRNLALDDPESAYDMMTVINTRDVLYKAQFAELGQMRTAISAMQGAAQSLKIVSSTTGDGIRSQLQGFVDQYNSWVQQFDADMRQGGLLADTQAARIARRELDQSLENIFNGAKDGLHGLKDIGITIDHPSGLAALDTARLDAVLATNKQGAVDAVGEFSANFAEAARLLNADGNFMPRQQDNLGRAIHYIADNSSALQAEFGTGDAVKPTGQIAQALAAYNRTFNI